MSYYYSYYLGIEDKESGLIKPLGPYNCDGELKPIVERSRSFASDLHDDFYILPDNKISEELRKQFEYEDYTGEKRVKVKYLYYEELCEDDYIVKGYFPIEDHQAWVQGKDDSLFYTVIDSHTYAELLKKEIVFGKNEPKKNEYGDEYTELNASDYLYDAIPNYNSKAYEAELIRQIASMLFDYELAQKYNLVVLETEG